LAYIDDATTVPLASRWSTVRTPTTSSVRSVAGLSALLDLDVVGAQAIEHRLDICAQLRHQRRRHVVPDIVVAGHAGVQVSAQRRVRIDQPLQRRFERGPGL
jgi:hypothetical protein